MIVVRGHVQERAMERYGLHLDEYDVDEIRRMIKHGEAEFIKFVGEHELGKVSAWKIKWEGMWIYPLIIFDEDMVLTFYTKNMLK